MEKEHTKKCFCARCFLPIEDEEKVDIGGQNFHRACSACCVCRQIPKQIKMFYGHVFCADCFKTHVLGQFQNEAPGMPSWCCHWGPGAKHMPQQGETEGSSAHTSAGCKPCCEDGGKKCICSRCLLAVDEKDKVDIGGQSFHPQCARCYICQQVPKSNVKVYYGQVFCEECFNRHVLNRSRDNPSEFFKSCFEQWQNVQFAENMRQFMGCDKEGVPPFVFCHCAGAPGSDWGAKPDARKSDESLEYLYFENRTEMSDIPESKLSKTTSLDTTFGEPLAAAEKIEKLTKYLYHAPTVVKSGKKWKNFVEPDKTSLNSCGWVDLQEKVNVKSSCPKCLWQCGPIFVKRKMLEREVCRANVLQ